MKLERVERLNLALSAFAIAAAFVLATPQFATSLAVGAVLEVVNFGALQRGARLFFTGEIAGARRWIGLFAMRFVLLAVAIFVVLGAGAQPVALMIGMSIAMPAVLIDAWRSRPRVGDHTRLPVPAPDDRSWDDYSVWRAGDLGPQDESDFALADEARRDNEIRGDR